MDGQLLNKFGLVHDECLYSDGQLLDESVIVDKEGRDAVHD